VREWLAMGGYAAYVWASYALAFAALAGQAVAAWARLRRFERALGRELDADEDA
jgi:heme exporter protein CcmD